MQKQPSALVRVVQVAMLGVCLLLLVSEPAASPVTATVAAPTAVPSHWVHLPVLDRNYDPSWRWQTPSPALSPIAANGLPVAAIDRQGQVHLLWAINASAPEGKYIYQSTLTPTGWTAPSAILPTLGTSYSPFTPGVGPDGALHLLWLNKLTSNSTPRLLYSVYRNGTWAAEEGVFNFPAWGIYDVSPRGTVQVDTTGQVYAIVRYATLVESTYQTKRTASGWQAKAIPNTGVLDMNDWMLGDQDGAVRRFVTRYENQQYHGYYSYWLDGTFLVKDAALPFVPHSTYLQLDTGNNLHVYWRAEVPIPGGQVMGLYHQCYDPNMAPASYPELLTGQEATGAWLIPAADENGRWTLAWQIAATGEAKIGIWQGCQRQKITSLPSDSMTSWPPVQALFSQVPNRWCGVWKAGTSGYRVRCAEITAP